MSSSHCCFSGCHVCPDCGICLADFFYTWGAHDEICRGCGRFTVLAQASPTEKHTFYPDEQDQEAI